MAIPMVYNLRSVTVRWTSAVAAVLGIAGTVGVFVAMLALANGFRATLVSSGSPGNAMVLRAGATNETNSMVELEQVKIIEDAPGVARGPDGPLVTPEVIAIAPFPLRSSGTDGNVQVRGVSLRALEVRPSIKIVAGRMFKPGLQELVVGRNITHSYTGLSVGDSVRLAGAAWNVVGMFDAGGSAFDSEVWCDARILNQVYHRPENVFQSVTAHLNTPDALRQFKDSLSADPRMTVEVSREVDYYDRESETLTTMIRVLGGTVAAIMAIGAICGALNTMYSAVAERGREVATMRALGFGSGSIVTSFLIEALMISFVGGVLGAIAVLPLNGLTTETLNWQTFSRLAFAFRITPLLILGGVLFGLIMGIMGGLPPALKAARRPVAAALRQL